MLTSLGALSYGQQIELIKDGPARGESKQERLKKIETEKSKDKSSLAVYLALDVAEGKEPGIYKVKVDKGTATKGTLLDTLSTPSLDKLERGKVAFKSEIDILNYLGSNGWEVISVIREPDTRDAQKPMSRVYIRKAIVE